MLHVINRSFYLLLIKRSFSSKPGLVESLIKAKLEDRFKPSYLQIINESYMHNVPKGSESHFRVVIVSQEFKSLNTLNRHRLVNKVLNEELKKSIHALAIETYTPEQWQDNNEKSSKKSPTCKGGAGL